MLTLSIGIVSDRIAHCLFSREPYRHLRIDMTVTNDGNETVDGASYELLVPEAATFNLDGDAWHPMHRHEIDGIVYDAWQTLLGFGGRYDNAYGGVSLTAGGRWKESLVVNLRPYETSLEMLWRLFEKGDPVGDYGKTTLSLEPFTARF